MMPIPVTDTPPSPDYAGLWQSLRNDGWIRSAIAVDTCTSTNDVAREAVTRAEAPLLVLARTQTAGRGRRGSIWRDTPGGSLLMSVAWRPLDLSPDELPLVSVAGALAGVAAAASFGVSACLKWPNDIWVGNRKLGGVLLQTVLEGPWVTSIVLGIGMNLAPAPERHGYAVPPTSLAEAGCDPPPAPAECASRVAAALAALVDHDGHPRREAVINGAREADTLAGRTVIVRRGSGRLRGTARGIASSGGLIVDAGNDRIVTVDDPMASAKPVE